MKYFEMHEVVYKKIRDQGLHSWDKSTSFEGMWSHATNVYLEKLLTELHFDFDGKNVLDLGTGTGTSALFTALRGASSVGVDISASAIAIAQEHNKTLGTNAEFFTADILELSLHRKFDLVIDSTILHCIVGESDRKQFYEVVKRHLTPSGFLFVNTMIASGDMSSRFPSEHFRFQDDVLWSLGIQEIKDRRTIEGKSYFPHRTILSEQKQLEEFERNGFEILKFEKTSELIAVLRVRAT